MATTEDHELAHRLAHEAGELLVRLRAEQQQGGADRWDIGDAGDAGAQRFLAAGLARARPDDEILSEEATDGAERLSADRVWIIDPVDGTREFGLAGRDDWAVHVALWERDLGLSAGAVALPAIGQVLSTVEAPELPPLPDGPPRIVVSRSRPPAEARLVADAIGGDLVPMGSAGAKAMAVVRGLAEAYVHAGGQYEWDNAAPAVVARAAGLHVSRLDGSPLRFNQPDPWSPDLVIARPELAAPVLDALHDTAASGGWRA